MDAIESMAMVPGGTISTRRDVAAPVVPARLADATPQAVADSSDLKKQQLAKDFEAVLLTRLFSEVRASIGDSGFDEDAGSDQIHGMFWSCLAQDVADKGGFGLWQDLYRHFQELEGTEPTGELIDKEL